MDGVAEDDLAVADDFPERCCDSGVPPVQVDGPVQVAAACGDVGRKPRCREVSL